MHGFEVEVFCANDSEQTVNVSKRLALLRGVLKRQDGALVSSCEHQMYNVDADAGKL